MVRLRTSEDHRLLESCQALKVVLVRLRIEANCPWSVKQRAYLAGPGDWQPVCLLIANNVVVRWHPREDQVCFRFFLLVVVFVFSLNAYRYICRDSEKQQQQQQQLQQQQQQLQQRNNKQKRVLWSIHVHEVM